MKFIYICELGGPISSLQTASVATTPGRKRSDKSRSAIIKATQELLKEQGFDNLSIEGIAARAKVGKATIYRWWGSKGILAMEAFLEEVSPTIEFPQTESASADLMAQIHKVAAAYRGEIGKIVREMIALGQFDEDTMLSFVNGYLEPRRRAAKEVLLRGIRQKEFKSTIDLEIVVDSLYGPVFHRMLTRHAPIDDGFVTASVSIVLNSILFSNND